MSASTPPAPPSFLSASGVRYWTGLFDALSNDEPYPPDAWELVAEYALIMERSEELSEVVKRQGLLLPTGAGIVRNPADVERSRLRKRAMEIIGLLRRCGARAGAADVKTVADVLDDAAGLIVRDGWQQGRFGPLQSRTRGPRCADGSILCALDYFCVEGKAIYEEPLYRAAVSMFCEAAGAPRSGISGMCEWNDAPGRTADEVIDALRRAATLARQAELA